MTTLQVVLPSWGEGRSSPESGVSAEELMHMSDALLSPAVGAAGWAVAIGLGCYSSRKLRNGPEQVEVPLMAVAAAFVFAAQMLNFAIPGTGASGHLGGGLILAAVLGPHAAFVAMSSILAIQALIFADGGLLALGCNIVNLGLFPCLLAYPLLFRPIVGARLSPSRMTMASVVAAVVGLQAGAIAVVVETVCSGVSALPFRPFALLMQSIHLAIGVVEGLATAVVLLYVWRARPGVLDFASRSSATRGRSGARVIAVVAACAALMGTGLSWLASAEPDGLEWSIAKLAGDVGLPQPLGDAHRVASAVQSRVAPLPDYGWARSSQERSASSAEPQRREAPLADSAATTVAGLVGSTLTVLVAGLLALALRRKSEGEGAAP